MWWDLTVIFFCCSLLVSVFQECLISGLEFRRLQLGWTNCRSWKLLVLSVVNKWYKRPGICCLLSRVYDWKSVWQQWCRQHMSKSISRGSLQILGGAERIGFRFCHWLCRHYQLSWGLLLSCLLLSSFKEFVGCCSGCHPVEHHHQFWFLEMFLWRFPYCCHGCFSIFGRILCFCLNGRGLFEWSH